MLALYASYNFGSKALSSFASLMIAPVPKGKSNADNSHAIFDPTRVGVSSVILVSQSMKASAANARAGLVKAKILRRKIGVLV